MSLDYDSQLLESVAVRRRRLRDAVRYGVLRTRRTVNENLTRVLVGLLIATVVAFGCAGWSYLQHQLQNR